MADNLNAAQIQAIEQKARDGLGQAIQAMNLRKWSMEQALVMCSSIEKERISELPKSSPLSHNYVVQLAEQIYAFVAKPAIEFKVEP